MRNVELQSALYRLVPFRCSVQRRKRARLLWFRRDRLNLRFIPRDVPPCSQLVADVAIHTDELEPDGFVKAHTCRVRHSDTGDGAIVAEMAQQIEKGRVE